MAKKTQAKAITTTDAKAGYLYRFFANTVRKALMRPNITTILPELKPNVNSSDIGSNGKTIEGEEGTGAPWWLVLPSMYIKGRRNLL